LTSGLLRFLARTGIAVLLSSGPLHDMATTQAYVTKEKGFAITSEVVPRPACGPSDVVVEMIASGLCRSDIGVMSNEWGFSKFPLVAGHEGVGRIVEVGTNVKRRKVGQLVGLGWMRNSCQSCRHCTAARENMCSEMHAEATGALFSQGGTFAEFCVSPDKFAIPIPENLDPVAAGPLLCAGITVYNPLATYGTHLSKVLVVALGGLGSLAVQFAAKMGCEVVSMSRGSKKRAQALSFGASNHIDSNNAEEIKAAAGKFDLILDTSPATQDMSIMFPLLSEMGRYVCVGLPSDGKRMEVSNFDVARKSKAVTGSMFGTISQMEDMMMFAARHGIVADCELMPMSQLAEAAEKLHEGTNEKMRIVLVRQDKLDALRQEESKEDSAAASVDDAQK